MSKQPVRLFLSTSSNVEDYDGGVSACWAEITPEQATKYLGYIEIMKVLSEAHNSLWNMRYWGGDTRFVTYGTMEAADAKAADALDRGQDFIESAAEITHEQAESMEAREVLVYDDHIRFQAVIKHTNVEISTGSVPLKTLWAIAKGEPLTVTPPEAEPSADAPKEAASVEPLTLQLSA